LVKRFLVTTSIESTWPSANQPILFLGHWCCHNSKKDSWSKRDFIIADYHWNNRSKLNDDFSYISNINEKLLIELSRKLNQIHSSNHSVRYWRIIIGPWLSFFIQVLFDRWFMLKNTLNRDDVSGYIVINRLTPLPPPRDMNEFVALSISDSWNEEIYAELYEWCNAPIKKTYIKSNKNTKNKKQAWFNLKEYLKKFLYKINFFILGYLKPQNDRFFFIFTYLPLKLNLIMQIMLGQIPKIYHSPDISVLATVALERNWQLESTHHNDNFLDALCTLIPKHMPTLYLEGYSKLLKFSFALPWPKHPKVIFTSNSFHSDELFKIWAAEKIEDKSQLVVSQHGGVYGVAKLFSEEDHQIAISDQFLTWGWLDSKKENIVEMGLLKSFGKKLVSNPNGSALMIEMMLPTFSLHLYSSPIASQWLNYFEEQCRFMEALTPELQNELLVRLTAYDYGWDMQKRLRDKFPKIQINSGVGSVESLMKKSRLVIGTYNATNYLESLSLNFPTILFWNTEHWEIRDSAKPYFLLLKSAGIFHDTPESAALHMSKIWNNVSSWWESREVQSAREIFCDRYAHIPPAPMKAMVDFFKRLDS